MATRIARGTHRWRSAGVGPDRLRRRGGSGRGDYTRLARYIKGCKPPGASSWHTRGRRVGQPSLSRLYLFVATISIQRVEVIRSAGHQPYGKREAQTAAHPACTPRLALGPDGCPRGRPGLQSPAPGGGRQRRGPGERAVPACWVMCSSRKEPPAGEAARRTACPRSRLSVISNGLPRIGWGQVTPRPEVAGPAVLPPPAALPGARQPEAGRLGAGRRPARA